MGFGSEIVSNEMWTRNQALTVRAKGHSHKQTYELSKCAACD